MYHVGTDSHCKECSDLSALIVVGGGAYWCTIKLPDCTHDARSSVEGRQQLIRFIHVMARSAYWCTMQELTQNGRNVAIDALPSRDWEGAHVGVS